MIKNENVQALFSTEWVLGEFGYEFHHENVSMLIQARQMYCDRGHWFVITPHGLSSDGQDGFPRFYMDLETAMHEMKEFLAWRLYQFRSYDEKLQREVLQKNMTPEERLLWDFVERGGFAQAEVNRIIENFQEEEIKKMKENFEEEG